MDLAKEFERRVARVQQLKNFVAIYAQKTELIVGLEELKGQADQASELLAKCKAAVEQFQNNNKQRYEQLIERARNAQTVMLNIMDKLDEGEDLEEQQQEQKLQKVESPKVNLPPKSTKNVLVEKRDNVDEDEIKQAKTPHKTTLVSVYIFIYSLQLKINEKIISPINSIFYCRMRTYHADWPTTSNHHAP